MAKFTIGIGASHTTLMNTQWKRTLSKTLCMRPAPPFRPLSLI